MAERAPKDGKDHAALDNALQLRAFSTLGGIRLDQDGGIQLGESYGNAFDDVLDWVHSRSGGLDGVPTEAEREATDRAEMALCNALARRLSQELGGQGFQAFRCMPDGNGNGYVVNAVDTVGRRFDVLYSYDAALAVTDGEGFFGRMVADICTRVLHARSNYQRRLEGKRPL